MQLYQLKAQHKRKPRKRVGRGGKRGTYSGRGLKGQKSRSGSSKRAGFSGGATPLFRRLPKKRGAGKKIKSKKAVKLSRYQTQQAIINLNDLNAHFKDQEIVSPQALLKKGLIDKIKGRIPQVKILGKGGLTKKLKFQDCKFSKNVLKIIKSKD